MPTLYAELYKLETLSIDSVELPLYRKLSSETISVDEEFLNKLAENEDLAISWTMSLVASKGVDLIKITIPIRNSIVEYAYTIPRRGTIPVMVVPRITRVYKILVLDGTYTPESLREIATKLEEPVEHIKIVDVPGEYYVYEIPFSKDSIKALSSKLVVLHTDDGIAAIDCSKISLQAISETSKTTTQTRTKKKSRKKKRKRKSKKRSQKATSPK